MAVASSSRTRSDMYKHRKSQSFFSSSSSGFASSTSSSFSSGSSTFFARSTSPTRISMYAHSPSPPPSSSSSVRFANRPGSPGRSISVKNQLPNRKNNDNNSDAGKRTCLCSPTTHPGSFRCALHKNSPRGGAAHQSHCGGQISSYHSSISLNYRRSAMKNSLVRIGGVEGDLVKRALSALIKPSSHSQRRRVDFQPKPSRLSVMSKASDDDV
ncbi:uncharacterized protein [Pyrus communis]|uniref:uncharacterized protein n=1 Tax=Pyrus communis TaxID=23211 RepID=UPI0035BF9011